MKKIIFYVGEPDSQDYGIINSLLISATSSKVRIYSNSFFVFFHSLVDVSALKKPCQHVIASFTLEDAEFDAADRRHQDINSPITMQLCIGCQQPQGMQTRLLF